jgi:integrase
LTTDESWLDDIQSKSNSIRSRRTAKAMLVSLNHYCKFLDVSKDDFIKELQSIPIEDAARKINDFVQFLNNNHDDIFVTDNKTFKKKAPKTIRIYISFLKSYLRKCHSIRITSEDFKDYVTFPRILKERRKAISISQLRKIIKNADHERKALYLLLLSSGMRLGEALQLKKSDFQFGIPTRINIRAEMTKTGESRETYCSQEAFTELKSVIVSPGEFLFGNGNVDRDVSKQGQYFIKLRERIGFTDRTNTNRFVISAHGFRGWFHTKATQIHDEKYAHALSGHGSYLDQYYQLTDETRVSMYLQLEPSLKIQERNEK